jgi:anion-transporting  ArsA/GET3 family ATPase
VVNRVLPADLNRDNIPVYLKNRINLQQKYMEEIRGTLGKDVLAYVPEMERDVVGLHMIERLAEKLF